MKCISESGVCLSPGYLCYRNLWVGVKVLLSQLSHRGEGVTSHSELSSNQGCHQVRFLTRSGVFVGQGVCEIEVSLSPCVCGSAEVWVWYYIRNRIINKQRQSMTGRRKKSWKTEGKKERNGERKGEKVCREGYAGNCWREKEQARK
jgi:hypothetical protein